MIWKRLLEKEVETTNKGQQSPTPSIAISSSYKSTTLTLTIVTSKGGVSIKWPRRATSKAKDNKMKKSSPTTEYPKESDNSDDELVIKEL